MASAILNKLPVGAWSVLWAALALATVSLCVWMASWSFEASSMRSFTLVDNESPSDCTARTAALPSGIQRNSSWKSWSEM